MCPISDLKLRIIHENNGLLVFNKPHNIPTSGKTLDDDDSVQYWLIKRAGQMVWAVHQLDADTSGVNLFVTRKELVPQLHNMLSNANTHKKYIAVIHGNPYWDEIEEKSPIGKINSQNLGVTPNGKTAHSKFRVLKRAEPFSLIEAQIFTGRTHQIRIHLAHLGHPLIGEEWYRNPPCTLHPRQLLHAHTITFNDKTHFTAPLPDDFTSFLQKNGLQINYLR